MIEPRWYQKAANDAVWNYLAEKQGNPVIVLPTGAGKSLVIAMLIQQAIEFEGRVVVLAHRKELLQQNAEEIRGMIPGVDVGIYSAGLKAREIHNTVVVAGIQSVFRKAADLGRRHLVLVDECHLISDIDESMYQQFFAGIQQEGLRIVGLTATPFRTGSGPFCGPDRQFHRIVFEAKTADLIAQGFLCPITNKVADAEVNTDKVALRGGEFVESEMQAAFDVDDKVEAACKEILDKTQDRHSVLIFASGVHHAEQIADLLPGAAVVTGETLDLERASILDRFRRGELRFLVNCDVLTTGFNAKCIDAIAVLRATMSPGLFCQMVGRGLRLHESKTNCLLLDFGGNIARHGSIDDDNFGRITTGSGRQAIAADNGRGKQCPSCELDVSAKASDCPECGFVFPRNVNARHDGSADTESQLTGQLPPEEWEVNAVDYRKHLSKKEFAIPTLRVSYDCCKVGTEHGNLNRTIVEEWVCLEHSGFAKTKAGLWWQARSECMEPDNIDDAMALIKMGVIRDPSRITTKREGKWYRILSVEFDGEKPTELREVEEENAFSGVEDDVPF